MTRRVLEPGSCRTCRAATGQPCRRPNGDRLINAYGQVRYHAARTSGDDAPCPLCGAFGEMCPDGTRPECCGCTHGDADVH